MTDMRRSLDILAQLFAMGITISIDDFGTGYSSLAYLKRLPVSELKIDRSFVQQLSTSVADATIVRTMVELAHSFGLRVVAEGIEDRTVLDMLTAFHCDLAQGYYFSKPFFLGEVTSAKRASSDVRSRIVRETHSARISVGARSQ